MKSVIHQLNIVLLFVCVGFLVFACGHSSRSTPDNDGGDASVDDASRAMQNEKDKKKDANADVATDADMDVNAGVSTHVDKDAKADAARDADMDAEKDAVCERRVLEGEVTNARDLGGWPLADGKHMACRRILRGGTLANLGQTGCAAFVVLGIRTVVDLRESAVQATTPAPDCVLNNAIHVSAAMPKLLPDTPENYLALWDQGESVRKAFSALGDKTSYPIYFHCEIGRDRTNFIAALILLALGADRQTVVEEFELSSAAGVAVKTGCIEAVVDEVEKRGGIQAVLSAFGVSDDAVTTLRAQMIAQ